MSAGRGVPWFPIVSGAGVIAIGIVVAFCASALSGVPHDRLGADLPTIGPSNSVTPTSSP